MGSPHPGSVVVNPRNAEVALEDLDRHKEETIVHLVEASLILKFFSPFTYADIVSKNTSQESGTLLLLFIPVHVAVHGSSHC